MWRASRPRRWRSSRERGTARSVITHRRPEETGRGDRRRCMEARDCARGRARCCFDQTEVDKHGCSRPTVSSWAPRRAHDVDICFALGGDGTILTALRTYAGPGVPVFGVNFGEIGFLATVDREQARSGSSARSRGSSTCCRCPGSPCARPAAPGSRSTTWPSSARQGQRVAIAGVLGRRR